MKENEVKELILEIMETSLELQLRSIRQMRGSEEMPPPVRLRRGLRKESLVDLSVKVLQDAKQALHVKEISRLLTEKFGRVTDPDSLSSSLGKKAKQGIVVKKTGKGYFALEEEK